MEEKIKILLITRSRSAYCLRHNKKISCSRTNPDVCHILERLNAILLHIDDREMHYVAYTKYC